ncbi:MAG: hypothetical protein ACHQCF_04180 [Solirubrobacterales bacterium]
MRRLRLAIPLVILPVAFALAPASALAGADTYYAGPGGSGSACKGQPAKPCALEEAVSLANGGDIVVLEPGAYSLKPSGLAIGKEIEIGGEPGKAAATVLETTGLSGLYESGAAKPAVHDLSVDGAGGVLLNSGSAERLFVSYSGASAACSFYGGTMLLDSVCWAHGGPGSFALAPNLAGGTGTVTLRNVTAVSSGSSASAIYAKATGGGVLTVEASDVIARSPNGADVAAILGAGGTGVTVNLSHSNYGTIDQGLLGTTVTQPGTNGNPTAAPVFVDAANGDFRQALGSPTIDSGSSSPAELLGYEGRPRLDLAGAVRVQSICLGRTPAIDIGAYEASPVDCTPENRFRITKQSLNRKRGTATLTVALPGAGSLTLSGPGLKSVAKSVTAGGTVKLPVLPVGKARFRLRETGKRKVTPKVSFTPTGGTLFHLGHTMVLRERAG